MSMRPTNTPVEARDIGMPATMPTIRGSRIEQVLLVGQDHHKRINTTAAIESTGAALLPRPAAPRVRSSMSTPSIVDELLPPTDKNEAVLPQPASSSGFDANMTGVDSLIDMRKCVVSDATTAPAGFAEAVPKVTLGATPEVTAVTETATDNITDEIAQEKSFLWTAVAEHVKDGELSPDGACFSFESVWHPMPSTENSYACVVTGNVVGEEIEKVREMETKWLPVGFSAGTTWWVRHQDGANLWVGSPDAGDA